MLLCLGQLLDLLLLGIVDDHILPLKQLEVSIQILISLVSLLLLRMKIGDLSNQRMILLEHPLLLIPPILHVLPQRLHICHELIIQPHRLSQVNEQLVSLQLQVFPVLGDPVDSHLSGLI